MATLATGAKLGPYEITGSISALRSSGQAGVL